MKKRDDLTNFGIRIPREVKPWVSILAWLIFIGMFLYGIAKVAERFSDDVTWP
jgi:hypothetical protein